MGNLEVILPNGGEQFYPGIDNTISWYTNYDSAVSVANAESRYILIEFYTDW